MEIVVRVLNNSPVGQDVLCTPHGPGFRFAFGDDLRVDRVDGNTPGQGLPQKNQQRRAGTHSGFVTTLRIAEANDKFFPQDTELFQYEAIYLFDAVNVNLLAALPRGQLTVAGAFWELPGQPAAVPHTFAITGGTGPYANARGQVEESGLNNRIRTLKIVL
jgi:hypothetical protein